MEGYSEHSETHSLLYSLTINKHSLSILPNRLLFELLETLEETFWDALDDLMVLKSIYMYWLKKWMKVTPKHTP